MIIDFHTHVYPDKIAARAIGAAEGLLDIATDGTRSGLERAMRANGIDRAVGLTLVNNPAKSRGINQWAADENHGMLTMLGSIHPREDDPLATLQFIADSGMKGIKVHPEYQDFRFDDPTLYPIWERCVELGLFVVTHAGSDIKFTAPFHTDPAALRVFHRNFPKLKLVLAHLGSMEMFDEVETLLAGENVWFDTAMIYERYITPEQTLRIIRKHGAERVLFGTDSPWLDQGRAFRFIDALPLTGAEKEWIFHRAAETLLDE